MKYKVKLSKNINLINKKFSKNEFYHYIDEPNNSLLIPIFKKKFLIVMQKRIPINQSNYEFPMGWVDKGESPQNASSRELLEETGYKSLIKPKKLMQFYADPGRGNRSCFCYFSHKLIKVNKPEKKIKIFLKSAKEIEKLIKNKKFNNSLHIAAFYYFMYKH